MRSWELPISVKDLFAAHAVVPKQQAGKRKHEADAVETVDLPMEDSEIFAILIHWFHDQTLPEGLTDQVSTAFVGLREEWMANAEADNLLSFVREMLAKPLGKQFRAPVVELWPQFAEKYQAQISSPIDLGIINTKLSVYNYKKLSQVRADFDLLYNNWVLFAGQDHAITKVAEEVRDRAVERIEIITPQPYFVAMPNGTPQSNRNVDRQTAGIGRVLCQLICLAEKFGFTGLVDISMDSLMAFARQHKLHPSATMINYVYDNTMPGSKLRLYVARSLADMIFGSPTPNAQDGERLYTRAGRTPIEWAYNVMATNRMIGIEVLDVMRLHQGVTISDEGAAYAPRCSYHEHGFEVPCPYATSAGSFKQELRKHEAVTQGNYSMAP